MVDVENKDFAKSNHFYNFDCTKSYVIKNEFNIYVDKFLMKYKNHESSKLRLIF